MGSQQNEEQLMELQALESIFMDDFSQNKETGEFSIRVVPSFGGAYTNYIALRFTAKFPLEYPSVPFESIQLQVIEGMMRQDMLQYLENMLIEKSQSLIGEPMVFLLVEQLKEELEYCNSDAVYGDFSIISDEIVMRIFRHLGPTDLAALAQVSSHIRRLAEEDELWKPLCQAEPRYLKYKHPVSPPDESEGEDSYDNDDTKKKELHSIGFWKDYYLRMLELVAPTLKFIGAVVSRKGTGDEWPDQSRWKEYLKKEMQVQGYQLDTTGRIISYGNVVGHFKFLEKESVDRNPLYNTSKWYQAVGKMSHYPTVYTGEVIGYVTWFSNYDNSELLRTLIPIVRGLIARVDIDSSFYCVSTENVPSGR